MKRELNLYNKYRPKCLGDFIGQTAIKDLLVQTFKKKKNPQAFIFYGSHGIGKTSLARILAKMFNCKDLLDKEDVCNKCRNCKLIDEAKTMDLCEVDAASNSGVDNMREMIQNSHYVPLDLKKKVYIIDEAHNLSSAAWNSLLKTIEEPPSENIIFLFLTTNINKIPDTILSRCQKYNFSKFKKEDLFLLIDRIAEGESKSMESDAKHLISSLSQGSARECVTLLESVFLNGSDRISVSDVERTFSLSNKLELFKLIDHLIDGDLSGANGQLEEFFVLDRNLLNFFSEFLVIFMDLYLYERTSNFSLLKKLSREEAEKFMGRGVEFLKVMETLEKYINRYEHSNDRVSWSKILLFNIWEIMSGGKIPAAPKVEVKIPEAVPPTPVKEKKVVEKKEPEPEEIKEEPKKTEEEKEEKPQPIIQEPPVEEKKEEEVKPEPKPASKRSATKKSKESTKAAKDKDFHINLEMPKISQDLENKIIYGLHPSNLNRDASLENFDHFKSFINSERPSKELVEIFRKIRPIENQLLTTNRTVVVYFLDELDAYRFNEMMRRDDFQEELENFFLKRYVWLGVSKDQLKYYIKICKGKKHSELSEAIFEKTDGDNLFREVIKILEEP